MKFFGLEIRRAGKKTSPAPRYAENNTGALRYSPRMSVAELMANSTVNSCVNIIADGVAVLPLNVYRELPDGGREKTGSESLNEVLKLRANFFQKPFVFKKQVMCHLLLRGNAYVFIERNGSDVTGLYALDPERVEVKKFSDRNEYYYVYYDAQGARFQYTADNIIHIPAFVWDGVYGLSPIEAAARAPGIGNALDEYTANAFDGGIHAKLLVTVPQSERNWTKEDSQKLSARLVESYGGAENSKKPMILSKGLTAQPLNLSSNDDAQLLENKNFSVKEIAKIFRVPLSMLGESDAKYNNNEQQARNFLNNTLAPWLTLLQEHFIDLIPFYERGGCYFEFNTNAMIWADLTTRIKTYSEQLTHGMITLNEVRRRENLPLYPAELGDKPLVAVNVAPLENALKKKDGGSGAEGGTDEESSEDG